MRRLTWLSLFLLGLSPAMLLAQSPGGKPSDQHRQNGRKPKVFKIFGSGSSNSFPERTFIVVSNWLPKEDPLLSQDAQDAALEGALDKARDQVAGYLREQKLAGEWKPKLGIIRDQLLADLRQDEIVGHDPKGNLKEFLVRDRFRAVEETRTVGDDGHETENRRVWLKVNLNAENWKQIQKDIRQADDNKRVEVMRSRMIFMVKLLAGMVALFGTVCCYLRLDEWSKGYYTKWLRLAALGCAGAVTVLLWMLVKG